jgi:hypothetical protein
VFSNNNPCAYAAGQDESNNPPASGFEFIVVFRSEALNLLVGRPFQAVIATKHLRFRRPEKGVLHFFTASERKKRGFDEAVLFFPLCSK